MSDDPCVDGCGQDAATIERLRAEVAELRRAGPWTAHVEKQRAMKRERDGDCICNTNPETTEGPDECCPWHGRAYVHWIERGDVLQERLNAVEALIEGVGEGNLKTSHLRAALETNIADDYERGRVHAEDDAYRHLRAALAPQNPPQDAASAPEAPRQPGRGEGAAQGDSEALDPQSLTVGDVIHIKWRGVDRDYRVTRVDDKAVTTSYRDSDGIGYAVLPLDGWGEHLGDPVEVTLVRKATDARP